MPGPYNFGSVVRLSCAFTDALGTAVDPTAIILQVKDPNGVLTAFTFGTDAGMIKDSVGNYHYDYSTAAPAVAGTYHYRWHSTGSSQAATGDLTFVVKPSIFT